MRQVFEGGCDFKDGMHWATGAMARAITSRKRCLVMGEEAANSAEARESLR